MVKIIIAYIYMQSMHATPIHPHRSLVIIRSRCKSFPSKFVKGPFLETTHDKNHSISFGLRLVEGLRLLEFLLESWKRWTFVFTGEMQC